MAELPKADYLQEAKDLYGTINPEIHGYEDQVIYHQAIIGAALIALVERLDRVTDTYTDKSGEILYTLKAYGL